MQNGVQLKIEYVSTETLVPFRGNPRKISPSGLAKLQRSVEEFGFVNPILAQRGTNMIIAGHQRLKAALYCSEGWVRLTRKRLVRKVAEAIGIL